MSNSIWESITSAADVIRRNTPDLTPVTDVYRKGYGVTVGATVHAGGAVTTKARELHKYLSDDQNRSNISHVAKNLSRNGALYLARSYGGGPVIDIVSGSFADKKGDSQKEKIKNMETRIAQMEKELSVKKMHEHSETQRIIEASKSPAEPKFSPSANQKPEDVLRIFMMKHFIGTKLLDDLIVPGAGRRRD